MNETEKYFWEWYHHCDQTGICDSITEYLNDKYPHFNFTLDKTNTLHVDTRKEMEHEIQYPASNMTEAEVDAKFDERFPDERDLLDEHMATFTLRDNKGRKITELRMTRREFLDTMKPLYDHFEMDKNDPNTYRGW